MQRLEAVVTENADAVVGLLADQTAVTEVKAGDDPLAVKLVDVCGKLLWMRGNVICCLLYTSRCV